MDPRFYQKILQNDGFSFKKNLDISNPKFQQNSIIYYFVFIFYFTYPNLLKNYRIFCSFIGRFRDFTNDLWKILKVLLKKY